jgi:hypothetical protein
LLAVRQALAAGAVAGTGARRVALRLSCCTGRPGRARAARVVLQDVARAEGAALLEDAAAGEMLLLGATVEGAGQVEALLAGAGIAGPSAPAVTLWRLPEDAAPLLAWAEAAARSTASVAADAGLAGLDSVLAAVPLAEPVLVRRIVLRLGAGQVPGQAFQRTAVSRRALAMALGPPGGDPDLLDHAAEGVGRRLLRTAGPAAVGPPAPPMLPLPRDGAVPAPPAPGAVGVLPLASALLPGAAARWRRLTATGWALGFDGLDAAALRLALPAALPEGTLLLLRWSAALGDTRAAVAALRALDPARLVLTGCDGPAAFAWGVDLGIRLFAGPAIEALRQEPAAPPAAVRGAAA